MSSFVELWLYLSATPLFGLTSTLVVYVAAQALYERLGQAPWANPVLWTVIVLAALLLASDTPYPTYFSGAQFIHFLLGSATVALAVPIYKGWHLLKGRGIILSASLIAGGAVSIFSAVGFAALLGIPKDLLLPFYAKSVTAPIAMGVAETIGASPTLTAVYAVSTGIIGAILARYVLDFLKITQWWQRGFAIGVAAHGIGTSRAFSVNAEAGAFASIGMGLHGVVGAIMIPWIL